MVGTRRVRPQSCAVGFGLSVFEHFVHQVYNVRRLRQHSQDRQCNYGRTTDAIVHYGKKLGWPPERHMRDQSIDIYGMFVDSYYVGEVPDVLRILAELYNIKFLPHKTKDDKNIWILDNHSITDDTLAEMRPFLTTV
jgi:hypothetical protein